MLQELWEQFTDCGGGDGQKTVRNLRPVRAEQLAAPTSLLALGNGAARRHSLVRGEQDSLLVTPGERG